MFDRRTFQVEEKNYGHQIQFLQHALDYLEHRIEITDQKVSIFMAIQAGVYVFVLTIVKDVIGSPKELYGENLIFAWFIIIYLIISLGLTFLTVNYMIQVIRPTNQKRIENEQAKVSSELKFRPDENYIMWMVNQNVKPYDEYQRIIANLDEEVILKNLQNAHYMSLKILEKKYKNYRKSVNFMKISVLVISIGLISLMISYYVLFPFK